jgi:hypothetical protein
MSCRLLICRMLEKLTDLPVTAKSEKASRFDTRCERLAPLALYCKPILFGDSPSRRIASFYPNAENVLQRVSYHHITTGKMHH